MTPRAASPYRKVYTQVWTSASFRALSPAAQTLWLLLLTGPQTSCIPGVMATSSAALSVVLGWTIEATRAHVAELVDEGMAEVDPAGMVFLPKALGYDPPANPNQVRAWRTVWAQLPACSLKVRVWTALREQLAQRDPAFLDAFLAVCPEPVVPSSRRRPAAVVEATIVAENAPAPGSLETVPETQSPEARSQKPEANTHTHSAREAHESASVPTVPAPPSAEPTPTLPVSEPPAPEPTSPVVIVETSQAMPEPERTEAQPSAATAPSCALPEAPAPSARPTDTEPESEPPSALRSADLAASRPAPHADPDAIGLAGDALAVFDELRRWPSLGGIATRRDAERFAGLPMHGIPMAALLEGLRDVAAEAQVRDILPDELRRMVRTYGQRALRNRRVDADKRGSWAKPEALAPTPKPQPPVDDKPTPHPAFVAWCERNRAAKTATADEGKAALAAVQAAMAARSSLPTYAEIAARQLAELRAIEGVSL